MRSEDKGEALLTGQAHLWGFSLGLVLSTARGCRWPTEGSDSGGGGASCEIAIGVVVQTTTDANID